jgi:hypothetical protein
LIHGQTIWDKNEQLLGINWELGKVDGNLMGVTKEHKFSLAAPPFQNPKEFFLPLSLVIGYMQFPFAKQSTTIFNLD